MKKCSKCKRELDESCFSRNKSKSDGLQTICKECRKIYNKKHYLENEQYYVDKAKLRKQKMRIWYTEYKKNLVCEKCGEKRWYLIQFHHREGKDFNISEAIANFGKEKILKEIEKCDKLCANCHVELHFLEKHG